MQLEGKLEQKFDFEQVKNHKTQEPIFKKNGEPFCKGGFVVKLKGKFPKDLFIEVYNPEMADFIANTALHTELALEVNMESRAWKDNWFTTVSAWKGDVIGGAADATAVAADDETDDLPF